MSGGLVEGPETVAETAGSFTGRYLKPLLGAGAKVEEPVLSKTDACATVKA